MVVPLDEKMRQSRLRWFDHVQMRAINALVRKNELIQVEEMKKKMQGNTKNKINIGKK